MYLIIGKDRIIVRSDVKEHFLNRFLASFSVVSLFSTDSAGPASVDGGFRRVGGAVQQERVAGRPGALRQVDERVRRLLRRRRRPGRRPSAAFLSASSRAPQSNRHSQKSKKFEFNDCSEIEPTRGHLAEDRPDGSCTGRVLAQSESLLGTFKTLDGDFFFFRRGPDWRRIW